MIKILLHNSFLYLIVDDINENTDEAVSFFIF